MTASPLLEVGPLDRAALAPLFAGLEWPRSIIDGALEGHVGTAQVAPGAPPAAAVLHVQVFSVVGGDPDTPAAAELVDHLPTNQYIIAGGAWYALLRQGRGHGPEAWYWRPYDSARLEADHLRHLAASAHAAYEIVPLDAALLANLWSDLEVGLPQHGFRSDADLLEDGFGYCAVRDGQVLAAALTFSRSAGAIEVQTNTHRRHQRRGLATATCAALVLRTLDEGLAPHWSAANHRSEGLAEKLGFLPEPRREVLYLPR